MCTCVRMSVCLSVCLCVCICTYIVYLYTGTCFCLTVSIHDLRFQHLYQPYPIIVTAPSPVRRLTVSYWTTDTVTLSWLHDDPYLVVGFDYMITATANGHRKRQRVVSSAVNTQLRYLRPGYRYTLAISVKQATRPYGNSVAVTTNVQLSECKREPRLSADVLSSLHDPLLSFI